MIRGYLGRDTDWPQNVETKPERAKLISLEEAAKTLSADCGLDEDASSPS